MAFSHLDSKRLFVYNVVTLGYFRVNIVESSLSLVVLTPVNVNLVKLHQFYLGYMTLQAGIKCADVSTAS